MSLFKTCSVVLVCAALAASASGQGNPGPDVIVGDLTGPSNYAAIGGIDAFAVGTTSCNIGTTNLSWVASTPAHPVIAQHMYRLHDGKFEMIGQSWLKHGFTALTQNLCDTCSGQGGSVLGVGCSDPYSSGLNGSQSGLGPKFEVNAATGVFNYPYTGQGQTGNSIYKRLQVATSDLGLPGARYFFEGHYVTADDAAANNKHNNASWRETILTGGPTDYAAAWSGATVREEPAIFAWKAADPNVILQAVDIPNDGRIWLGYTFTALGGGLYAYEFAIHNLNSDRSVGSVSFAMAAGANVSAIGFHDVAYHSGEPFSGTDWVGSYTGSAVTWATTPHATNANANAIRWGTLYNFRFVSDTPPGPLTLGLFKPGATPSVTVPLMLPAFVMDLPAGAPAFAQAFTPTVVQVDILPLAGAVDPGTAVLVTSQDGGPALTWPLANIGGNTYQGLLPPFPCGSTLDWYVSASPLGGGAAITLPADAPAATFRTIEYGVTILEDHAETNIGWTVTNANGLTDGAWDRGVPVGGGDRGDPALDSDGSGQCWLTDNVDGNSDVDAGSTTLTSPAFDLANQEGATLSFDFWFTNDFGATDPTDTFVIELSANGSTWVVVETVNDAVYAWRPRTIAIAEHVALTSTVRVRFTATDLGAGSVVEAGLDNVRLEVCRYLDPTWSAGTVGSTVGGPHDVLTVNGGSGGLQRRVVVPVGAPITFGMAQSPASAAPAPFAILGHVGHVSGFEAFAIPGIGTMSFVPCPAAPFDPALFVLANNLVTTACAPLLPAFNTPWSFTLPGGLPFEVVFALQGVIQDPTEASGFAVTNAVLVDVRLP